MSRSCIKSIYLTVIILCTLLTTVAGQTKEYPKIGDTLPSFILNDIHYSSRTKGLSSDYKGKPLIIDFFSIGCKACFESFPELNALKKEYEGRIQFLLIAKKSPTLQKQYENYMKHYNLTLTVDYDDSTIWNQFGVLLVPYTIWVDEKGIIKQITTSFAMSSNRLNDFIQGKSQSLAVSVNQKDEDNEKKGLTLFENFYDNSKPLLIGGNGGSDNSFLYRSIITKWDYRSYFYRDQFISKRNKNRIQEIGVSLNTLFNFAYGDTVPFLVPLFQRDIFHMPNHYGQWANYPVVESSDSADFFGDIDSMRNIFSYSLIVPDSNISAYKLQHIMQRDLKNYFNKQAWVEKRLMPCWKIVAGVNAENKCRTNGGEPLWESSYSGFKLKNQPINSLLVEIWGFFQTQPVFVDETGISYNIDLNVNAIMMDIHDIQRALRKYDLDLVRSEKEMNVIVVRDSSD